MNAIDLKGQKAVVTGAARGIGYAIAERLLASGAAVALWDVDESAARKAALDLSRGGETHAMALDVTQDDAVRSAAAATEKRMGRIDILVNNAGIAGSNATSWNYDPSEWRRIVEIDLVGVFLCARAVLPSMLAHGYGRIVNIASVAGKEGNAGMLAYSTSKAAVIGMTKVVGKELAETGIVCNAVAPAVVRTAMVAALPEAQVKYMTDKIPMKRTGEIAEIAALAAFAASRECSFTTGFTFDATGGRATY